MIHIEHTSVAGAAMMASLWFEYVTHQAVSFPFIFVITKMKAPEYRNLSWISGHRLEKGPHSHYKQKVVNYK